MTISKYPAVTQTGVSVWLEAMFSDSSDTTGVSVWLEAIFRTQPLKSLKVRRVYTN